MREIQVTKYKAADGRLFDNEEMCREYELKEYSKNFSEITITIKVKLEKPNAYSSKKIFDRIAERLRNSYFPPEKIPGANFYFDKAVFSIDSITQIIPDTDQ